jgi:tetratricopeptide (TPR) repeat protein
MRAGAIYLGLTILADAAAMTNEAIAQRLDTAPVPSVAPALALHQQGRLDEAAALYAAVLARDPRDADALHLFGVLRHQQGRSVEALRFVAAALKAKPPSPDILSNCGVILAALDHHQAALASFEQVLAMRGEDAPTHYNRGNALKALGRSTEAGKSYDRALTLDPDYVDARLNRGSLLAALRRHNEALLDYDRVLALRPGHVTALNRRGDTLAALERPEEALAAYDTALAVAPDSAEAHNNRSVTLGKLERFDEALQSCDRALVLRPDYADAHYNRGNALRALARFDEACASYAAALDREPRRADALNNWALALIALDRHAEALEKLDAALAINPNAIGALHNRANALVVLGSGDDVPTGNRAHIEALNTRGVVLAKLRRFDEALASYDAALDAAPDRADILVNRGTTLLECDRYAEALESFDAALTADPKNVTALVNRANARVKDKRYDEALGDYDQALALSPDHAAVITDRGVALAELDRFDEALAAHDQALRLGSRLFAAHVNRGNVLLKLTRVPEALACYDAALAIDPESAEVNFNAGMGRLLIGDFRNGWKQYEYRWNRKQFAAQSPNFTQPMWRGETDVQGKTIFLISEQGLGDTLNFVRYAPLLAERGATVLLGVPPPLKTLAPSVPGVTQVFTDGEAVPAFDYYCPLLSLPLAFGTTLDTIPANIPYIRPYQERLAKWRDRLPDNGRVRVGICWAGGTMYANNRNRSIPLERFAALLDAPGVDFVSVQKDVSDAQAALLRRHGVAQLGQDFKDFADTAAVVAMLDLVVSVDTSVAHLTGAMGKPVALLLPFAPDFRWLLERTDSPWYPTMRLYRQPVTGDWVTPIARLRQELADVARRPVPPRG